MGPLFSPPQHRSAPIATHAALLLATAFLLFGLVGCSSSTKTTPPVGLQPANFSIAATPATLSLTGAGAAASTSVAVTGTNGFVSPVSVALSGLPTGVTASPVPLSITPGTPQPLTLTAASTAVAGTSTVTLTATSGSLTHTATLTLTVAAAPPPPAPDFTLSATPASLTLTAGAAGQPTSISVAALNSFSSTVTLTLSGLPTGVTASPSTLTLTPGTPQSLTLTAAANAALGAATVTLTATSGSLSHTAALALNIIATTGVDITTYHVDNARTGLNPSETTLTLANVNSSTFGKLNLLPTLGKVDAEPLYLSAVPINGQSHNVLYVASEDDSVYAFDADTGAQLWKTSTIPSTETTSDAHSCDQISPQIGITSTPVIDRHLGDHGEIFVVAMSKDGTGAYHQRLHALDITTGADIAGSPTEITGTYPGTGDNSANGVVTFDPGQYAERVGLLLQNQTLYLAWTSHCDHRPYTGWVMAYSETSLAQTSILNLTPNGSEGSVWMSGAGLAGDAAGNIFFLDANGTLDPSFNSAGFPSNADFGNAILKLSTAGSKLAVADFFEPYNTNAESDADIDLGSGGVLLLPDQTDSTGATRHLLVGAGKDHNIYIADRDHLGAFNSANNSNIYQELPNALPNGAWSMPAYFNNTVFYGGVSDVLRAYPVTGAKLSTAPASTSAASFPYPGTTPGISSNGTANGIVWAVESGTGSPAVLHAYDATDLTRELYNSNTAANSRDSFGNGNKFITPLIVNGKVYIGTPTGVAVFGLLPTP